MGVSQPPVGGTVTATYSPSPLCPGGDAVLTSVGSVGNVAWYSAAAVFNPKTGCQCPALTTFKPVAGALTGVTVNTNAVNQTTCYAAKVFDPAGICPPVWSTNIATVNVHLPPSPPAITGPPYICCGKNAIINLTPGPIAVGCTPTAMPITFQLINLSTGVTTTASAGPNIVTSPGNYQAVATNSCGSVTSSILTILPDDLAVTITGPCCDCKGVPITLTANPAGGVGPYSYLWNTGGTGKTITVSPTVNTTYTVTVTDHNGCTATFSFTVTVCG